ncbi:MAG: hypothetical protein ABSG83_19920 [Roseiarcus sp.]
MRLGLLISRPHSNGSDLGLELDKVLRRDNIDRAQRFILVLVCGECHVRTDGWTIECWELKVLGGPRYAPLFDRLLGSAESRAILQSQRTRDALKAAKARGTTRTGALFTIGNPRIEEARKAAARAVQNQADRFAANVAPLIEPLRKQGMSLAAIAGALEARGVKSARGQRWHAAQVADVLRRAA